MLYIFPKDLSPKFISFWTFFLLFVDPFFFFPPSSSAPYPLPILVWICWALGFPDGAVVKESAHLSRRQRRRVPFLVLGIPPGEGSGNPLKYSFLGNSVDRGALRASVHGVAKNQTKLSYWACTHRTFVLPQFCFFIFQIRVVEKADLGSRLPGLAPALPECLILGKWFYQAES